MSKPITYQDSGVNPEKAGELIQSFASFLKTRPKDPNIVSGIGPFAACYSIRHWFEKNPDPILVTCCDGVGTKLKLALEWNDLSGLGQDLVGMNVNDLLCAGAEPALFLDYYACGKLDGQQLHTILKGIQSACEESQCSLVGGETAEMPGLYEDKDFDLAGFSVGIADRGRLLGPARVQAGDRILGLTSTGFHSNGYSLVRRIVEQEKLAPESKAPFSDKSWKELLLAPTRLYVRAVKEHFDKIHACAHITGGGLYENLPRVLPEGVTARIQSGAWSVPPLFRWFQEKARIEDQQLLSTFNCGIGMIVIAPAANVKTLFGAWEKLGYEAREIGTIEASSGVSVRWE